MSIENDKGILLETGTNEVEIMEFYLEEQSFGINVAKVKQIVQFDQKLLTQVPESNKAILGTFQFRDASIPLIDLGLALGREKSLDYDTNRPLVLVTEFNNTINGFKIDAINRIHRLSWNNLKPLDPIFSTRNSAFTGSIKLEGREMLIVDVEHLLAEINPEISFESDRERLNDIKNDSDISYENIKLIVVEDSNFIRESIVQHMLQCGFKQINSFKNGKEALDYVMELKSKVVAENKDIFEELNIVVSDIEMPELDGLSLCKKIKEDSVLKKLPVVVFSSLINQQMRLKCEAVGADACASKPKLADIISIIIDTVKKQ